MKDCTIKRYVDLVSYHCYPLDLGILFCTEDHHSWEEHVALVLG